MKPFIFALALLTATATQEVSLRYHWVQGDVLNYRSALHTVSTVSGMPGAGDVTLDQTMTQNIRLLVAAVATDGSATVQQTIDSVKIEMNTPMGKSSYDSTDVNPAKGAGSDVLATVFGGMVGGAISITFAPSGAVQRISGASQLLDKLLQGLPPDPRAQQQMGQSLRSVLSDEALRASLEQSFSRLPAQPLKAGDTWTGQVSLGNDMIGKIVGTQVFTLKSVDGNTADIAVALTLKQESALPVGPGGMVIKVADSKGTGAIRFDVTKGRILRATMETEMPSVMSMTGPDGRPATLKNTTKTSMTMELK